MRWKVLEFYGKRNDNNKETFVYKYPPSVPELSDFKGELTLLVSNIEFRNINNDFQKKLKSDINEIKTCNKILVSADKSRNLYKLEKDQYQKLLKENITKSIGKISKAIPVRINEKIISSVTINQ